MKKIVMIMTITLILAIANIAQAEVPHLIRYQGYITDKNTPPQGLQGDYAMKFSLYDSQTAGNLIWSEVYDIENKIPISAGQFSVLLGSITPLDNVDWQDELWLSVEVNGEEMQERQRITSVPLAIKAESAEKAKTIEGDVLYVDTETKSVGIGTTAPRATLEVAGNTDTYTKLLLHLNGQDGLRTFIDETGKTVIANGNAQIDTEWSKFGGASGLFNSATKDYLSLANSDDWNFGDWDFTIDFWVRFSSLANTQMIMAQWDTGATPQRSWQIYYTGATSIITFRYSTDNSNTPQFDATVTLSEDPTWYHFTFVRSGANFYIFQDGVQIGSTGNIGSDSLYNASQILTIGCEYNNGLAEPTTMFNGWLDEVRISKGIARWTEDFSDGLPTKEYVYGGGDGLFAGKVKAKAFDTGDITFRKDGDILWRMYEEEDGLYLENLKAGGRYRLMLDKVE